VDDFRCPPESERAAVELSFRAYGAGDPVLFLPPAATRADVWLTHQVPAFVAAGYQAVVVDNRGTAPSPAPAGPYRLADLAADAAALIARLGLGPCRVVGASLGAMITQELAAHYPGLVHSVALLGTRRRTDVYRQLLARAAMARALAATPVTDADVAAQLGQMFGPQTLADDREVADWAVLMRRFPVSGPGPAAQYHAAMSAAPAACLTRIGCPCLVMGFEADVVTPPASCRDVRDAIRGSKYVEIPGTGHLGFLERPEPVNAALTGFFATAVSAG
jgi:pimeloyl-ACP methyl ester carboxylesterase